MQKRTEKLNKLQTLKWILRNFILFKVIRIYFSRIMMTITIYFFPKLTYLFSFNRKLPPPKDRIIEKINPTDEWIFKNFTDFENFEEEVSDEEVYVFFKKESADFRKYKNTNVKKFLINWETTTDAKNVYYSTSDGAALSFFVLNKRFPFFMCIRFLMIKMVHHFILKMMKNM